MQYSLFDHVAADQRETANDYHLVPATPKQLEYARKLAQRARIDVPRDALNDRNQLSQWIETHKQPPAEGRFSNYPSSRQVAFAERIARIKHRNVPQECFRDRVRMSKWIDSNT